MAQGVPTAYLLTQRARRDILDIWEYIASDDEAAADRFIERLIERFQLLGENPRIGRPRPDLRPHYRSVPVGSYVVLYDLFGDGVRVLHVVHGSRDLPRSIQRR